MRKYKISMWNEDEYERRVCVLRMEIEVCDYTEAVSYASMIAERLGFSECDADFDFEFL